MERGSSAFQEEKVGFQLDLQQRISEREEAERQVDEDVKMLQKQVKAFKLLKYLDRYNDGGKAKRRGIPSMPGVSSLSKAPRCLPEIAGQIRAPELPRRIKTS